MKKIDFSNHLFRAHAARKLLTGTIGLTDKQEERLQDLILERKNIVDKDADVVYTKNKNGNKVMWTDDKEKEWKGLNSIKRERELPKTIRTELRKIHRAETYNRSFSKTNKYVEKGILEEDEAITVYQNWLMLKGRKTLLIKNDKRLTNDYYTGEPDLTDNNDPYNCEIGIDIKASWELDTFPFPEDELDESYQDQDQVYMDLTGAKKWITAYVLVNCSATRLLIEVENINRAYNYPSQGDRFYEEFLEKAKETEARLVFDRERFDYLYPGYDWYISKKEWYEKDLDIPLEDRVVEFIVDYDGQFHRDLKARIRLSRRYLNSLNG